MAQVVCTQCKKTKDSTFDFYWTKTARLARCKECQKAYVKAWREQHFKKAEEEKDEVRTRR